MVPMAKMVQELVEVMYEDDYLMVVIKPAGMVTTREGIAASILPHNDKGNVYLEDWVAQYCPNNLVRKGIVHRLDKDTSGLVVVAKSEESLIRLKDIFKKRRVIKKYVALVGGEVSEKGEIKMPIKRSVYAFGRFKVDADGKMAETHFVRLKKIVIDGKKFSLVSIDLKTGRTHQIRVHFSYLGWPLAGDVTYGGTKIPGLNRQFLHSEYLEFEHPFEADKKIRTKAPLPTDLEKILDEYAKG